MAVLALRLLAPMALAAGREVPRRETPPRHARSLLRHERTVSEVCRFWRIRAARVLARRVAAGTARFRRSNGFAWSAVLVGRTVPERRGPVASRRRELVRSVGVRPLGWQAIANRRGVDQSRRLASGIDAGANRATARLSSSASGSSISRARDASSWRSEKRSE